MVQFKRPGTTAGMHHLALNVSRLHDCVDLYTRLLGMTVEWQPDEDNYYLTSGSDNLALHRAKNVVDRSKTQSLDHLGFIIDQAEDVARWFDFLKQEDVVMMTPVKHHRDGACSFYCKDPDGNVLQIIYHPPLSSPGKKV